MTDAAATPARNINGCTGLPDASLRYYAQSKYNAVPTGVGVPKVFTQADPLDKLGTVWVDVLLDLVVGAGPTIRGFPAAHPAHRALADARAIASAREMPQTFRELNPNVAMRHLSRILRRHCPKGIRK